MTKGTTDLFGKVCVQLAKRYAAEDRYDDAIAVLQQIPKGSTSTNDARYLLKRYRRILDNKQP